MNTRELALFSAELRSLYPELEIREEESMAAHCSFRIGGPCDVMLFPGSEEEIHTIASLLKTSGEKPFFIGNGTNLLITDEPLHRVVVRLGEKIADIKQTGSNSLSAHCGISLSRLAVFAEQAALSGLEFAHGIPGTLGGAVSMNAGAYGGEMKQVVSSVRYLNENLDICECTDGSFSYRHSRFSDTDDIILNATFRLTPGDESSIRSRMQELMEKRKASQPLDKPSAGSTFKRPKEGYAAALIDEAGLRGYSIGDAQVSEKHCGFVINKGCASFSDVMKLMDYIRERVFAVSGVELEPEVKIIRN